jgi:hypothetical protein
MLYSNERVLRCSMHDEPGGYQLQYSMRGYPVYVWRRPVPRIHDILLDIVIYLYPSVIDAQAGEAIGGSGFLVAIPSTVSENDAFIYAVTNSHVIRKIIEQGNSPVIRLNTEDGGKDVIETSEANWVHHQDGDDVAVCPLLLVNEERYKFGAIAAEMCLTQEEVEEHHIGPGDEVIMAGRFISHEGRQRNTPTARFGNISMLPWEPIPQPSGVAQESFLVEMRSLSGFSGSPVFVYIPANMTRVYRDGVRHTGEGGLWLLGVDWAHLRVYEDVLESDRKTKVSGDLVVEANSGQMAVVPAWRLQDLLDLEELVVARQEVDEKRRMKQDKSPVVLDMRTEATQQTDHPSDSFEPFTRGDFEDALDRVSRPEKKPDDAS